MLSMDAVFTKTQWEQLPEGFPAELIEGCLVRDPAPTYGHQSIASRIRFKLLRLSGPDLVPDTPADVLVDDVNIFEPDIVVLRERPPRTEHYVGIPLLVVEVLSPSTAQRDRTVKKDKMLEAGVEEVWLVDPKSERIEIHRSGPDVQSFGESETAHSLALPGFALMPSELFAD